MATIATLTQKADGNYEDTLIDAATVPVAQVSWRGAVGIIRGIHPPIDLFEDIADPADWPLLISAEQKTNPRLMVRTSASLSMRSVFARRRRREMAIDAGSATWLSMPSLSSTRCIQKAVEPGLLKGNNGVGTRF